MKLISLLLLLWLSAAESRVFESSNRFETFQELMDPFDAPQLNMDDVTDSRDVIFIIQVSGITERDISFIRQLIEITVNQMEGIGQSRVSVIFFNKISIELISFSTCCSRGRSHLLQIIQNEITLKKIYTATASTSKGDQSHINPDSIDVEEAFLYAKLKYLSDEVPLKKPTLILYIGNLNSPYTDLLLYHRAYDEIKSCKQAGAWLMSVLVDEQEKRLSKRQLSNSREIQQKKKLHSDKYLNKIKSGESTNKEVLATNDYDNDDLAELVLHLQSNNSIIARKLEKNLAEIYVKKIASTSEDGLVISDYSFLIKPIVTDLIAFRIKNPTTWFGEAEITSSCKNTKNGNTKILWSPNYFISSKYPSSVHCVWKLRARKGWRIYIKFEKFKTEETFDKVDIFDDHIFDPSNKLASFSGDLNSPNLLPVVTSTNERISIRFTSDSSHNKMGFVARWQAKPQSLFLKGFDVVYLVDTSSSISIESIIKIRRWISVATKLFDFDEKKLKEVETKSNKYKDEEVQIRSSQPSRFGLIKFGTNPQIISSIKDQVTRTQFISQIKQIEVSQSGSSIGKALDFSRIMQFNLLSKDLRSSSPSRKIIFILSDASSLDDLKRPSRRLCDNQILPILIGVDSVDPRGRKDLLRSCGLFFSLATSPSAVVMEILEKLGLDRKSMSHHRVDLPMTSSSTFPLRPTSTIKPRKHDRILLKPDEKRLDVEFPSPRKFNFLSFLILLVLIGGILILALMSLIYLHILAPKSWMKRNALGKQQHIQRCRFNGQAYTEDLCEGCRNDRVSSDLYPCMINSFWDMNLKKF